MRSRGAAFAIYLIVRPHDSQAAVTGAMFIIIIPIMLGGLMKVTYQIGMTIFGDRFPPR